MLTDSIRFNPLNQFKSVSQIIFEKIFLNKNNSINNSPNQKHNFVA